MSAVIVDLDRRLRALEEALVGAATGRYCELDVEHDDPLAAIEVGFGVLVEDLRSRIEEVETINRELSTPVLQLWKGVIAMPIIGVVDTVRAEAITERLLAAVSEGKVRFAILDVTGVEVVDTNTAAHLLRIVQSTALLGSQCILTGVQPVVAQTLVGLGVEFDGLVTRRDLQAGLRACLVAMEDGA